MGVFGDKARGELPIAGTSAVGAAPSVLKKFIAETLNASETRPRLKGYIRRINETINFLTGAGAGIVKTNRLNEYSTTAPPFGTGAFTTGAFTPSNNSLLVVCVSMTGNSLAADRSADLTLTDSLGSIWTRRLYVGRGPTFGEALAIFTTPIIAGASMTLTVDCGIYAIWAYAVNAFDFTGYNNSSPIGGTITKNAAAADGAESLILSSTPAASSFVLGFYSAYPSGVPTSTPGADFTEIYETGASAYTYLHSQGRTGSTSTTVAWVDVDAGAIGMAEPVAAGIEIKASTASEVLRYLSMKRLIAETVRLTEAIVRVGGATGVALKKFINETLQIAETTRRTRLMIRRITETINLTEVTRRMRSLVRRIAETINLTETTRRVRALVRRIAEAVNLSDFTRMTRSMKRLITETVQIADAAVKVLQKIIKRIVTEIVQLADAARRVISFKRMTTETVQLSETTRRVRSMKRLIAETINLTEAIRRVKSMRRAIAETINLTETTRRVRSMRRAIAETVQLNEFTKRVITSLGALKKIVTETLQLSETTRRARSLVRRIAETVNVTEFTRRARSLVRRIAETVNVTEFKKTIRTLIKRASESLQLVETTRRAGRLVRSIAEILRLVDVGRRLVYSSLNCNTLNEYDPQDRLSYNTSSVTGTGLQRSTASSYCHKEIQSLDADDVRVQFSVNVASATLNSGPGICCITDKADVYPYGAGFYGLNPFVYYDTVAKFGITEYVNGTAYTSGLYNGAVGTTYYCTAIFQPNLGTYGTFTLQIYGNAARTSLLSAPSLALHEKRNYKYLLPITEVFNAVQTGLMTLTVSDIATSGILFISTIKRYINEVLQFVETTHSRLFILNQNLIKIVNELMNIGDMISRIKVAITFKLVTMWKDNKVRAMLSANHVTMWKDVKTRTMQIIMKVRTFYGKR